MKSPLPEDPCRLEVSRADVRISPDYDVFVTVVFRYSPWEPSSGHDKFFEQSNALRCVRGVLDRGGVDDEL